MFKSKIFAAATLAVAIAMPVSAAPLYSLSAYDPSNHIPGGFSPIYNSNGDYATTSSSQAAFYNTSTGTYTLLGTLGGDSSFASSISDNRKVAGNSYITGNGAQHAFLWDGGIMQDLGTLGGTKSEGSAVNDNGWVVGGSHTTGNAAMHAFLWDGVNMQDLGSLVGDYSYALDINNSGQIVGRSGSGSLAGNRAVLWENGVLYDLNDLLENNVDGWTLHVAYGINHEGLIYAQALDLQGGIIEFLLTPINDNSTDIPEPAGLALLGISFIGLTIVRRRRAG